MLSKSRRRPAALRVPPQVGSLEPRRLFATVDLASQETVTTAIPNVLSTDTAMQSIPIASHITDPNVPGTLATFETSKGNILVALTDQATPLTVANFLSYVNSGAYDDTIFHRSAFFDGTNQLGTGGSAADPANIIQGGGYTLTDGALTHITTNAAVADEFSTETFGDVEGTLALANTGSADTGTSEFFFNNTDNTSLFDTTLSYTDFGHVLGGMDVVTAISSLPTTAIGNTSDFPDVPIQGLTAAQIANDATIGSSNLVYLYGVVAQAGNTYTVTSSDPSLVNPSIANGDVTFKYATAATGTAEVTVTATNAYDGTTASDTFAVTVAPTSSTTTGPVAAADTAANVVTGVATPVNPLVNDTDATAALDPATLTVVTQPAHGTATVDGATGNIVYTATAGFTGTDTLTYAVSDADGYASAATTVTLDVVATPLSIGIGAGQKLTSIAFTQPDGVKGHLGLSGGSAVVTFTAGNVTSAVHAGVETVTGATIANVVVTNGKAAAPSLTIGSTGKGTATLGGLTDAGGLSALDAPTTTLTGALSVAGLKRLTLAAASHATAVIGATEGATVVSLPTATDTSLAAGVVTSLTSRNWVVDDGGSYQLYVSSIGKLTVTGAFADTLAVTSTTGYAITSANVNKPSAAWEVEGEVRQTTVTAPTATWAMTDDSLLQNLTVRGDLLGTVTAAGITDMTVTGNMTGATVSTDSLFNAADVQLVHLSVAGTMTDSTVSTAGNLGTVTAESMTGSHVYAGYTTATGLPTTADDLSAEATIQNVTLRAPKATFANSDIAAYVVDHVTLGHVTASNGGTAFGVSAHTLSALSATLDPGGSLVLGKAQTKSATVLAAYLTGKKIALSDFAIDLY